MEKCVEFDFFDKRIVFYDVDNFDLETIRNLPSYHDKWYCMRFLNASKEKAMSYDAFFNYPSGMIEKTVYYGKKISYAEVRRIVGNDKKYSDLLELMEIYSGMDAKEGYESADDVQQQLYENNYCLFTMPISFNVRALLEDNALTIEEFDPEIKVNYDGFLKAIEANSVAGDIYIKEHELLLKLFKGFFEMLSSVCQFRSDDDYRTIFESYIFNFKFFAELKNLNDINIFLDICDYIYNFNDYCIGCNGLFGKYRAFVNEYYEDLELVEGPKF